MAVATPAMPASTVAVTNNTGQYVAVAITGGTLTFVYVNGVQAGTTAGNYALPPGATISITYSVAPTWAWTAPIATSYPPGYAAYNPGAEGAGYSPITSLPYAAHALSGFTGWGVGVSN
jgi:hypothetical protein